MALNQKLRRMAIALMLPMILQLLGCVSSGPNKDEAELAGQLELARQFIQANRSADAVGLLQSISKTHPNNAQAEYLLGMALLGLKDTGNAIMRFRKSIDLSGDNDDARVSLAFALIAEKKLNEADAVLKAVLDRGSYPYMERVHMNIGLLEIEKSRCPKALRAFDEAIKLDPTLAGAYFNRGKCLVRLGKVKLAADAFEKAVRFCPGCADPQLELARVQLTLGQKARAQATLKEIMETQTDDAVLDTAKKLFGRASRQQRR